MSQQGKSWPQYEDVFSARGVVWAIRQDVPIDTIKVHESAQCRSKGNRAPQPEVESYAQQLEAGTAFPPVVMFDGYLYDGNTRLAAHAKAKREFIDVYEIQAENELQAQAIAVELNQTNGRRLAADESRAQAVTLIRLGKAPLEVQRLTGVSRKSLAAYKRQADGEARARRMGMKEQWDALPAQSQQAIPEIVLDDVFSAMVGTVADDKVKATTADVKKAVRDIQKTGSESEQLEKVAAFKTAHAKEKPPEPPYAMKAKELLDALLGLDRDQLVNTKVSEEMLPRWQEIRDLAAQVCATWPVQQDNAA